MITGTFTPSPTAAVLSMAEEGNVVDDATVHWPESRKVVELGEVVVNR